MTVELAQTREHYCKTYELIAIVSNTYDIIWINKVRIKNKLIKMYMKLVKL